MKNVKLFVFICLLFITFVESSPISHNYQIINGQKIVDDHQDNENENDNSKDNKQDTASDQQVKSENKVNGINNAMVSKPQKC